MWAGVPLGARGRALAVLARGFGHANLNGYGKPRMERAFVQAHPGCRLRLGNLDYSLGANCLAAQSVTLSATNTTLKVGRVSLTGVGWSRLLWGSSGWADVLTQATLDATNIEVEFPQARYGIHCRRLRASVPNSELIAEGSELKTLVSDQAFFAAHPFRTTRFHLLLPECRVVGLAYAELLAGKSYRATSIHCSRPSFEALVNRDQPVDPSDPSPLMVGEALTAISQPVRINHLSITNGDIRYCEQVAAGAAPGVLTFDAVNLSVEGLANQTVSSAAILLRGQGNLMSAGVLQVQMAIPLHTPGLALHYSGSLGAMDLTRLGAFLDIAEHTRIKSGQAQEAVFEIDVAAGQARGQVHAIYRDLKIAFLDPHTGSESGVGNRVGSFLVNTLKLRASNVPDTTGSLKEGKVNYTRKPTDAFLQFAWYALRSGVLDVINH